MTRVNQALKQRDPHRSRCDAARPARHHRDHLLHWALHQIVGKDVSQKGSYVGPEKLTFDFNSQALSADQLSDVERLVNERILENAPVSWQEVPYESVKTREDVMQFFGDKYGETVRVVQIGGTPGLLDGYSMELCGGTHTRGTGEVGVFRMVNESAIAAGIRRIEAVAGWAAYDMGLAHQKNLESLAGALNSPVGELQRKVEGLILQQKQLEKQLRAVREQQAAGMASQLIDQAISLPAAELPSCPMILADREASRREIQTTADALSIL